MLSEATAKAKHRTTLCKWACFLSGCSEQVLFTVMPTHLFRASLAEQLVCVVRYERSYLGFVSASKRTTDQTA
jgi:hypothetical protein